MGCRRTTIVMGILSLFSSTPLWNGTKGGWHKVAPLPSVVKSTYICRILLHRFSLVHRLLLGPVVWGGGLRGRVGGGTGTDFGIFSSPSSAFDVWLCSRWLLCFFGLSVLIL